MGHKSDSSWTEENKETTRQVTFLSLHIFYVSSLTSNSFIATGTGEEEEVISQPVYPLLEDHQENDKRKLAAEPEVETAEEEEQEEVDSTEEVEDITRSLGKMRMQEREVKHSAVEYD